MRRLITDYGEEGTSYKNLEVIWNFKSTLKSKDIFHTYQVSQNMISIQYYYIILNVVVSASIPQYIQWILDST